jgi:hypothetical protein
VERGGSAGRGNGRTGARYTIAQKSVWGRNDWARLLRVATVERKVVAGDPKSRFEGLGSNKSKGKRVAVYAGKDGFEELKGYRTEKPQQTDQTVLQT